MVKSGLIISYLNAIRFYQKGSHSMNSMDLRPDADPLAIPLTMGNVPGVDLEPLGLSQQDHSHGVGSGAGSGAGAGAGAGAATATGPGINKQLNTRSVEYRES